ncbi:GIY-YIG nuclease family protein [Candidatus Babeliales bacterium]|nr:GIY-YIG nuclease family protein [Candidatus Babeliales bacterium]
MLPFYVYILKCSDDSYYTGHTDDIDKRLHEHKTSTYDDSYTSSRLPFKLVFMQEFATRYEALAAERKIKGWGRKKKEALIAGDWEKISQLASRKKI